MKKLITNKMCNNKSITNHNGSFYLMDMHLEIIPLQNNNQQQLIQWMNKNMIVHIQH